MTGRAKQVITQGNTRLTEWRRRPDELQGTNTCDFAKSDWRQTREREARTALKEGEGGGEASGEVIYVTRDGLECVSQGRAGHRPRETSLPPPRRPTRAASVLPTARKCIMQVTCKGK